MRRYEGRVVGVMGCRDARGAIIVIHDLIVAGNGFAGRH